MTWLFFRVLQLSLLVFFQSSLSLGAECEIQRSVSTCAAPPCMDSVSKDFAAYRQSELACGVFESSLPFVMTSAKDRPNLGTVVLVHGLTAGPDHMKDLAQKLVQSGYNVVVPILKGHGGSDDFLLTASLSEWKRDVEFAGQIAKNMGGSTYLLGHSTGGLMAALEAKEHPGQYKAYVGLDPALNFKGELGWRAKYACLAKRIWAYPGEIFEGHESISDWYHKDCTTSVLHRDPAVIQLGVDMDVKNMVAESCGGKSIPIPHYNIDRPLQALCTVKRGADEVSTQTIANLPPAHLELTNDQSIYNYISRDKMIGDVTSKPGNTVSTLATGEIEKNTFHDLMLAPCAEHYPAMVSRIIDWFKSHP